MTPMVAQKARQMAPQNCGPPSEVMAAGTPNRVTQAAMRAPAQSSAVVETSRTASIHLVVQSITVNRYLYPPAAGRGPTRSPWRGLNRRGGMGMCCGKVGTWCVTLDLWQVMQSRTQVVQLLRMPRHTYLAESSRRVARVPSGPAHEQNQRPVFAYIPVLEA